MLGVGAKCGTALGVETSSREVWGKVEPYKLHVTPRMEFNEALLNSMTVWDLGSGMKARNKVLLVVVPIPHSVEIWRAYMAWVL